MKTVDIPVLSNYRYGCYIIVIILNNAIKTVINVELIQLM